MKKFLVILMVVVFAIPMLNSCKKGENDPFISLKSREGRLKGEWALVSGTETNTSGTSTYSVTYTGTMATVTFSGNSQTYAYTETIEFLKDNEFKSTVMNDTDLETCTGFWAFMDGYGDDVANKECLVIRLSSITSGGTIHTYTGDEMPMYIIRLDKLSGSEAIMASEGTSVGTSTSTTTSTKTYEKK